MRVAESVIGQHRCGDQWTTASCKPHTGDPKSYSIDEAGRRYVFC